MRAWDCYCAVCGGPFSHIAISDRPRTALFLSRRAKEVEDQRRGRNLPYWVEYWDDASDDGDGYDEDHNYDRDVITAGEVQWTETLHVLGLNPHSERSSKVFVSGPGTYNNHGSVSVEKGDDPNAQGFDLESTTCYHKGGIFPFHWCCYQLLAKCLTGSFDDAGLDRDLLYRIMEDLTPHSGGSSEFLYDIHYDVTSHMQREEHWETVAGFEFVVSHPWNVPGASDLVSSMFRADTFRQRSPRTDLGGRVRRDPFLNVPYDIVHRISCLIADRALVNLARASWPVHVLLRNNNQFWWQRLRASLPWFFELREFLEQNQMLLQTNDVQLIYQWAERSTRAKKWLSGPLMGLANRRRIWSVCEQLGERYWPQKEEKDDPSISDEEILIRRYSHRMIPVTVSSPRATNVVHDERKVFWTRTWSEIHSQPKMLESFWDQHGSLIGISLQPDDQKRRLLGLADSDDGTVKQFVKLGTEEWIQDLIIHMPVPTQLEQSRWSTSPKGLTIILDSGRTSSMGDTSPCHMQRFFSAAPDWYITGINGRMGVVMGSLQLCQLGLLQTRHPDVADYSVPPRLDQPPGPKPLKKIIWDEDYSHIFGRSIREHQRLRLIEGRVLHQGTGNLTGDLVRHGALIWAKDAVEHRALTRLTGCIASGGKDNFRYLCGVNAEFEPATDLPRRVVGFEKTGDGPGVKPPDLFDAFDIDGPGGEVVTELEVPFHAWPGALKIHTNRGRACSWGEAGISTWSSWESLKAPAGETLVGIVVTFGGPNRSRSNDFNEILEHYELSVVAGLSMPLGLGRTILPAIGVSKRFEVKMGMALAMSITAIRAAISNRFSSFDDEDNKPMEEERTQ